MHVGRLGGNVVYIPDTTSADIAKDSIMGRLRPGSDVGYANTSINLRSWRGQITERL